MTKGASRTCLPALAALAAGCIGWTTDALAQQYPAKTIRIIVGYSPGGGTDVLSRLLGKKLTESWGQTVVVDNRVGAAGILASEIVAKSAPDGYTLMTIPSTHAINPSLYKKLPYESIRDFTMVGLIATSPNVLHVHPSLPVKSTRDLIALARKRPGDLSFSSAGVGSTTHLAGEYFRSMAKINAVHVPYKGSGQAEIDLAMGQVQYMIDSTPAALPNIKAGRTRPLATTGKERFSLLPELPTIAESGLPGYESISWWGIVAPGGMPQALTERLNKEISRIMNLVEVKEQVRVLGADSWTSTPQRFLDYIREETALYAKIIKEAGIRIE
jgi:tripartite-type tricarboxylate transporter receptor subunit TctC